MTTRRPAERAGPHLYELLSATETVDEFAAGLARAAVDHLGAGVSCGLTALMESRTVAIASSDELAANLDRIQDATGEGPCVQAIVTGRTVEVTDLTLAPGRSGGRPRTATACAGHSRCR